MEKRIGDPVKKGESICTIHARTPESAKETGERILAALEFTKEPCEKARLLYDLVDRSGVHIL